MFAPINALFCSKCGGKCGVGKATSCFEREQHLNGGITTTTCHSLDGKKVMADRRRDNVWHL